MLSDSYRDGLKCDPCQKTFTDQAAY